MLGGVCGGLAEYFSVDSTLVRLTAVALTLAWGTGILAYLIFWFAVPQRPLELTVTSKAEEKEAEDEGNDKNPQTAALFIGIALIAVGFLFLLGTFLSLAWLTFSRLWPLALIAIGALIILRGSGKKREN
jgi:phage shock protein PspC (stress-responsive transcriptional regulator)